MNANLAAWNEADESAAIDIMLACCGAKRWAAAMVALRPIATVEELRLAAERIWSTMKEADWLEAFACHPRIGARKTKGHEERAYAQASQWSRQEQSSVRAAADQVLAELEEGNALYEERYGFTCIVCATGKSAEEMLDILNRRLAGDRASEMREAAEQQRQILQIRLGKWLVQ